jgi:hypothetical protein
VLRVKLLITTIFRKPTTLAKLMRHALASKHAALIDPSTARAGFAGLFALNSTLGLVKHLILVAARARRAFDFVFCAYN